MGARQLDVAYVHEILVEIVTAKKDFLKWRTKDHSNFGLCVIRVSRIKENFFSIKQIPANIGNGSKAGDLSAECTCHMEKALQLIPIITGHR